LFLFPGFAFCEFDQYDKDYVYEFTHFDMEPYAYTTEDGKKKGVLIEQVIEFLDATGMKYTVKSYPPKRLFFYMLTGKIDFWFGVHNSALGLTSIMGERVFHKFKLNVYSKGDKPPIKEKKDFEGKSVIIISGYSYGGLVDYLVDNKDINAILCHSHTSGMHMLEKGRADYLLDYELPADHELKNLKFTDINKSRYKEVDLILIGSKRTPFVKEIIKHMEENCHPIMKMSDSD
jgi:polar amino acid transport system substrate-binding protein